MIQGFNPSSVGMTEDEFTTYAERLADLTSPLGVINNLKERRENVINGGTNCIPLPFERFRSEIPGIEQGQYVVVTAPQKSGKCFGKGTRVRMADNTIKNIEDIHVGDWVMSPNDELPKQVESLGSGKERLYKISSVKYDDLIVNESHILYLYNTERKEYYTATVKEILEKRKTENFRSRNLLVASDECDFHIHNELAIEPYYYGLWLGDGSTKDAEISTPDAEIVEYLQEYASRLGFVLSEYSYKDRCNRYRIARKHNNQIAFRNILYNVCQWQKQHINKRYLNASIESRYQLLAGIIDTDGYLNGNKTGYRITMQYESMINDIRDLARSLGLSTTINKKYNKHYDKYYYILNISGKNCIKIPVRVLRKKCVPSRNDPRHYYFNIECIGEGEYYGITLGGNHLFLLEDYTIVHNTQWANYVYLFKVLDYAFENPTKCSVHIIYFALEEAVQKVIERYMSYLLYKFDGYRLAPADLRSTSTDYPVPQKILELLDSKKYKERLDFFEKNVQFETEDTNPTGVLRVCEKYAKSVGQYKSHTMKSRGVSGAEVEVFDSYKQNDPNHYKIIIIDHIGLVDREQGFKAKDAIDKMSEYFVKYLRNRYNFTCVAIQQQASESEGLEAIKAKRMVPTAATLADSKYTARDADLVLGLFDPSKFGLPAWCGYNIQDRDGVGLKTYGRFLYVLANRNGEMGGICPLFFDGAVCNFEELPKPDDVASVGKYYDKARTLKSYKQQKRFEQLTSVLSLFVKSYIERKH